MPGTAEAVEVTAAHAVAAEPGETGRSGIVFCVIGERSSFWHFPGRPAGQELKTAGDYHQLGTNS